MINWFKNIMCFFNMHKFSEWKEGEMVLQLEGRSKPHIHTCKFRYCDNCKELDELPLDDKWH